MSRKGDHSASGPPIPDLPSSTPQTLWAQHRRAIVVLSIAAVALALLTAGAIILTYSTEPAKPNPELEGIVAGADASLNETKEQVIDVLIWIGWCVGAFLIGFSVYSELRQRRTGDRDAEAVQDGDPIDPD